MMAKAELRQLVRERLRSLGASELAEKSAAIRRLLLAHPAYQQARTVALFAALPSEPHLDPLHDGGKRFCFPKVNGPDLDFHEVENTASLINGALNVREPSGGRHPRVDLEELDLVLVPGVAFSPAGGRLGRGGGFYDRLLCAPQLRARRIGICFDLQLFQELPLEAHDREVEEVLCA